MDIAKVNRNLLNETTFSDQSSERGLINRVNQQETIIDNKKSPQGTNEVLYTKISC